MILRLICLFLVSCFALEGAALVNNPVPIHEAYVSKFTDQHAPVPVPMKPPTLLDETRPSKPYMDATWIQGYWAYAKELGDYVWVHGVWRRPPPEHGWISGEWVPYQGGWMWSRGFWSPTTKLTYIEKAPPQAVEENIPPSPGETHFWISGYWAFSATTKQYTWLSGKWWAIHENWVLAPANYIKTEKGYVFVPAYWDYSLKDRGKAYRSVGNQHQEIREGDVISQLFIHYPDYQSFFHHWSYFHPEWSIDSWFLPPWWKWSEWWTFSWNDMWGLWWWWGHPGALPPEWMTLELSSKLNYPTKQMVDYFGKIPKPDFGGRNGRRPLFPTASSSFGTLPKPFIPSIVKSNGQIIAPVLPQVDDPSALVKIIEYKPEAPKVVPQRVQQPLPVEKPKQSGLRRWTTSAATSAMNKQGYKS